MIPPNTRGTNLETKLLEVRHISKLKCFYFGLPNSVSRPAYLNVCGLSLGRDMSSAVANRGQVQSLFVANTNYLIDASKLLLATPIIHD